MAHVRRLLSAALVAGAISGLAAFGVQHIMVEPLLLKAEIYEDAARRTQAEGAHAGHEWKPSDGFERTAFTCLSTVLTGVGYAALLLGLAATLDVRLDLARGAVAGVAAFACLSLAPALGLPPQLPGSAVADLQARQLWWLGTVIATAIGLWLFIDSRLGLAAAHRRRGDRARAAPDWSAGRGRSERSALFSSRVSSRSPQSHRRRCSG